VTIELAFLVFALVVVTSYTVQTATGFGGMLVAVTLGAQLMGIEEVIRLMVPLSFLQTGYIAIRHRDGIDWSLLLRRILPLMALGMSLAFLLLTQVRGPSLGLAFGFIVLALAGHDLYLLRSAGTAIARPVSRAASVVAILSAGVIHGIYASGGPMLVYAVGREGLSKKAFRSTISTVWIALNLVLVTRFLLAGAYDRTVALEVLMLVPAVPLGILLGEWVHGRVDERAFKTVVLLLLIAAAISLIVRYSAQLL